MAPIDERILTPGPGASADRGFRYENLYALYRFSQIVKDPKQVGSRVFVRTRAGKSRFEDVLVVDAPGNLEPVELTTAGKPNQDKRESLTDQYKEALRSKVSTRFVVSNKGAHDAMKKIEQQYSKRSGTSQGKIAIDLLTEDNLRSELESNWSYFSEMHFQAPMAKRIFQFLNNQFESAFFSVVGRSLRRGILELSVATYLESAARKAEFVEQQVADVLRQMLEGRSERASIRSLVESTPASDEMEDGEDGPLATLLPNLKDCDRLLPIAVRTRLEGTDSQSGLIPGGGFVYLGTKGDWKRLDLPVDEFPAEHFALFPDGTSLSLSLLLTHAKMFPLCINGGPGEGKSTFLKLLCRAVNQYPARESDALVLARSSPLAAEATIACYLRAHTLFEKVTTVEALLDNIRTSVLGLRCHQTKWLNAFDMAMNEGSLVLLIDGVDEAEAPAHFVNDLLRNLIEVCKRGRPHGRHERYPHSYVPIIVTNRGTKYGAQDIDPYSAVFKSVSIAPVARPWLDAYVNRSVQGTTEEERGARRQTFWRLWEVGLTGFLEYALSHDQPLLSTPMMLKAVTDRVNAIAIAPPQPLDDLRQHVLRGLEEQMLQQRASVFAGLSAKDVRCALDALTIESALTIPNEGMPTMLSDEGLFDAGEGISTHYDKARDRVHGERTSDRLTREKVDEVFSNLSKRSGTLLTLPRKDDPTLDLAWKRWISSQVFTSSLLSALERPRFKLSAIPSGLAACVAALRPPAARSAATRGASSASHDEAAVDALRLLAGLDALVLAIDSRPRLRLRDIFSLVKSLARSSEESTQPVSMRTAALCMATLLGRPLTRRTRRPVVVGRRLHEIVEGAYREHLSRPDLSPFDRRLPLVAWGLVMRDAPLLELEASPLLQPEGVGSRRSSGHLWVRIGDMDVCARLVTNHDLQLLLSDKSFGLNTQARNESVLHHERLRAKLRFSLPNQPAVGVSPHLALEYARWRTTRDPLYRYALLPEAVWERMARKLPRAPGLRQVDDGRESQEGFGPMSVCAYPLGAWHEGSGTVYDVKGGVRELCDPIVPTEKVTDYPYKGASWLDKDPRTTYWSHRRKDGCGFRLCRHRKNHEDNSMESYVKQTDTGVEYGVLGPQVVQGEPGVQGFFPPDPGKVGLGGVVRNENGCFVLGSKLIEVLPDRHQGGRFHSKTLSRLGLIAIAHENDILEASDFQTAVRIGPHLVWRPKIAEYGDIPVKSDGVVLWRHRISDADGELVVGGLARDALMIVLHGTWGLMLLHASTDSLGIVEDNRDSDPLGCSVIGRAEKTFKTIKQSKEGRDVIGDLKQSGAILLGGVCRLCYGHKEKAALVRQIAGWHSAYRRAHTKATIGPRAGQPSIDLKEIARIQLLQIGLTPERIDDDRVCVAHAGKPPRWPNPERYSHVAGSCKTGLGSDANNLYFAYLDPTWQAPSASPSRSSAKSRVRRHRS